MKGDRAGEPQYEEMVGLVRQRGLERLGLMTSWAYYDDPKRLAFMMARYKFVSKMLDGAENVLEAGCGDGFGSRLVAQSVRSLTAVDFDPEFIESAKVSVSDRHPITFLVHDFLAGPIEGSFDGIYSLDVLEHIEADNEEQFLANVVTPLRPDGVCIVGMPSLESQAYASKYSREGHVNCKDQPGLKKTMGKFFRNIFIFSMNDEVIHTGYGKMSHYNIALCCGKIA
jgi:2-polyprenyl-3-methyl-5-hydroxy-6-metoxy-1,4-benzoquinol methylase